MQLLSARQLATLKLGVEVIGQTMLKETLERRLSEYNNHGESRDLPDSCELA
jgi:hypothetical protein